MCPRVSGVRWPRKGCLWSPHSGRLLCDVWWLICSCRDRVVVVVVVVVVVRNRIGGWSG
jgi:hypothetical protein